MLARHRLFLSLASFLAIGTVGLAAKEDAGFLSLFDGKDLAGWKVPAGDNGHWKVVDGVIDYDARSESTGTDKCLWSDKSYRDFVLKLDWRLKTEPGYQNSIPIILPDGSHKKGPDGKELREKI